MKKTYERPIVLVNQSLAEGVFLASGGNTCYTATATITQKPETGRQSYTIQLNGVHETNPDHCNDWQLATITFNQEVTYVSCNGQGATCVGSTTGTVLQIQFNYHQNAHTNIGLGDLVVTSADGLAVTGITISDEGHTRAGTSY